ncbi:MAG: hypothetical protein K2J51_05640 [Alistipes sp.]|nr:hypothetical protein [Alistipes sp.]
MKNLFEFVFVAAAAMALSFCSKDETVNSSSTQGLKINVVASSTRTVFDTDNIKWSGDEEMALFVNGVQTKSNALADVQESGQASFMFVTDVAAPGSLKLQGAVPASSVLGVKISDKANNNAGVLQMELKSSQAATAASFDPAADILVSQDCDFEVTQEDLDFGIVTAEFYFGRIMAVTRYAVTNTRADVSDDEVVESVQVALEVGAGNAKKGLTGRFYFDISKGRFVDNEGERVDASTNPFYANQSFNYVTVAYPEGSRPTLGELNIWTVTAPVTMEAGDKLVFTVKTDRNTIVKTSTLKAPISLVATNLNTSTVKIADNETCVVTPIEKPSDDLKTATLTQEDIFNIVQSISGTGYQKMPDYTNAYGVWVGGEVNKQGTSVEKAAIGINTTATRDSYIRIPELPGAIRKVVLQLYTGSKNAVYLSESNSTANPVAEAAAVTTARTEVEMVVEEGDYSQLYIVGGSVTIKSITVYYEESTAPKITVADADKVQNISAAGDVVTVPFKAANLAGDVTASCDAEWVNDIEVSAGEVSFMVDASDLTAERTAVLTIQSEADGVSAEVELVQAPAAPIIVVDEPAEFAAAGDDIAVFEYTIAGTGAVEGASVTADVVYDGDAADWITISEVDTDAVWFEVAANDGGARTAAIKLTYAKGETVYAAKDVAVSQAKSDDVEDPAVSVEPAEWAPAAAGETRTFDVALTDTDAYEVETPEWITVDEQTAASLKLTASANETGAARTGAVTLTVSNGKTATIEIAQDKIVVEKYYVKVTNTADVTDGKYLIVFNDSKAHGAVSGKDLIASTEALTITDDKILSDDTSNAGAVEIAGSAIKLADGSYLSASKNSCGTSTSPVSFTFEYTSSGMKITNGGYTLQLNGTQYFRFYTLNSGYKLPNLYKLQ